MNCPKCGYSLPQAFAASAIGKINSPLKIKTARANGKLGGRPKGSKNKPKSDWQSP